MLVNTINVSHRIVTVKPETELLSLTIDTDFTS